MRFLITAGPTREPIDPVRYISNRSSGKMGYAIAEAALAEGHDITLISGPVNLETPHDAKLDFCFDQRRNVRSGPPACGQMRHMRLVRRRGGLQVGKRFIDKNQKARREVFARTSSHARHSRFVRPPARSTISFSSVSLRKQIRWKKTPRRSCAQRIATFWSQTM